MDRKDAYRTMYDVIQTSHSIFVIAHKKCTDGVGAMIAISHYLEDAKKPFVAYVPTAVPESLRFLEGLDRIQTCVPTNFHAYDCCLVLDCGDVMQTGIPDVLDALIHTKGMSVINVDHHQTNTAFGHYNIIDTRAAATCEMIYAFLRANKVKITSAIANALLVGIFADTGNFTNHATNLASLEYAADLVLRGAQLRKITESLSPRHTSVATLKLWGRAFSRIIYNPKYSIAATVLLQKDFEECGVSEDAADGIINYVNNLQGIRASLLLREMSDGTIKGSFRTNHPRIDISRIARMMGGGGHTKAAGFSLRGRLMQRKGTWRVAIKAHSATMIG